MRNNKRGEAAEAVIWLLLALFIVFGVGGCAYLFPKYKVYSQTYRGTADFKEAEINRQIVVEEARAQEEALQMRARGEAEREKIKADATAYAIEKIGQNLSNHPSYLRWLWINEVAGGSGERIYIPTEAGIPILEAGASVVGSQSPYDSNRTETTEEN